jgi:hypothetical protein
MIHLLENVGGHAGSGVTFLRERLTEPFATPR